jgi:DNA-binding NarL/FixJ family response regulator
VHVLVIDDKESSLQDAAGKLQVVAESLDMEISVTTTDGVENALQIGCKREIELILLDYHMAGQIEGIDALRVVRSAFPESAIIMYSGESEERVIMETIREGASGFIHKSYDRNKFRIALQHALEIGTTLPPQGLDGIIAYSSSLSPTDERRREEILAALTPGQLRVLKLAVQGLQNKEIARKLNRLHGSEGEGDTLSPKTVQKHLSDAFRAMKVKNRVEAVKESIVLQLFADRS